MTQVLEQVEQHIRQCEDYLKQESCFFDKHVQKAKPPTKSPASQDAQVRVADVEERNRIVADLLDKDRKKKLLEEVMARNTAANPSKRATIDKIERDLIIARLLEERRREHKHHESRRSVHQLPESSVDLSQSHHGSGRQHTDDVYQPELQDWGSAVHLHSSSGDSNSRAIVSFDLQGQVVQDHASSAASWPSDDDNSYLPGGIGSCNEALPPTPPSMPSLDSPSPSAFNPRGDVACSRSSSKPVTGETALDPECTFKPKINEKYQGKSAAVNLPFPERMKQWQHQTEDQEARRMKLKAQLEEQSMQECTFQPEISKKAKGKPREDPAQVAQRLFQSADKRVSMREKARERKEEEEVCKLPFSPEINEVSREVARRSKKSSKPIQHRVAELQKQKSARLHHLKLKEYINDPNLTFHPQISECSESLALASRKGYLKYLKPHERLSSSDSGSKLDKLQAQAHRKDEQDLTFTPEISENSKKIVQDSKLYQGLNKDFVSRQAAYEELREQTMHVQAEQPQLKDCTFKPDIGNASEVLLHSRRRHTFNKESELERVERLANKDRQEREMHKKQLTEQHFAGYTFAPEISEGTRALISKGGKRGANGNEISGCSCSCGFCSSSSCLNCPSCASCQSTTNNQGQAGVGCSTSTRKTVATSETEFQKAHTFKPQLYPALDKNLENVPPKYQVSGDGSFVISHRVEEDKLRIQQKLRKHKQEALRSELKECTFAPHINNWAPPDAHHAVQVPGLQRFLETKQQALALQEDHKRREERAFHGKGTTRKHNLPYTIPEPFAITGKSASAAKSMEKVKLKMQAAEEKECTFRPDTLERRNKQLIQRILSAEESTYDD